MSDIPDVVQAKAFQLVDDSGKVRAELSTTSDGDPSFVLLDEGGQIRLSATLNESQQPFLALFDQNGQGRFQVCLDELEQPQLCLYGKDGRLRLGDSVVRVDPATMQEEKERPSVHMTDRYGRERIDLGALDQDGRPRLRLNDENGKVRFR